MTHRELVQSFTPVELGGWLRQTGCALFVNQAVGGYRAECAHRPSNRASYATREKYEDAVVTVVATMMDLFQDDRAPRRTP